jgi:hypothetical protein
LSESRIHADSRITQILFISACLLLSFVIQSIPFLWNDKGERDRDGLKVVGDKDQSKKELLSAAPFCFNNPRQSAIQKNPWNQLNPRESAILTVPLRTGLLFPGQQPDQQSRSFGDGIDIAVGSLGYASYPANILD